MSAEQRFFLQIQIADNGCHIWQGPISANGYGRFTYQDDSKGRKIFGYAHRWSYEFHKGRIRKGWVIDHLCRNRACVNPKHLEQVTHRKNILRGDSVQAENAIKTHCPRGHEYDMTLRGNRRFCRECHRQQTRESMQRWRERKRERNHNGNRPDETE